jgi:phosphonate transport system substrate-binding protein
MYSQEESEACRVNNRSDEAVSRQDSQLSGKRILFLTFVIIGASALALYHFLDFSTPEFMGTELVSNREIRLDVLTPPEGEPSEAKDDGRSKLRVAIAPVISPEESIRLYRGFVEYLARKLGREPVLLQRDSYGQTNDLLRYRKCDVALVCTYAFVRGESEFGAKVLAIPVIDGATTYQSFIVVPRTSQAASLLDLRGKRFASADLMSTSGWLYPAIWLRNQGRPANQFFSEHLIVGSHDRSVRSVASGYADGAAVDSLVFDQVTADDPSVLEKTRIIQKSSLFGMPPFIVSPQIDPELKQQLQAALLEAHKESAGKDVLAPLNIDRFVVPEDSLYDDIRDAVSVWEAGE